MDKYIMQVKTIYVQEDETKKSQIFTINISKNDQFVDVKSIIMQIPNYQNKNFQIYSPKYNAYLNFQDIIFEHFLLPRQYFQLQYVMIKYCEQQESQNPSEQNKKQRSKQRNIRQVIELVHKWRQLHQSSNEGKKMNLQDAAKIVGISKKSLDDYFFQLRMGEKYGFDFSANMDCKVGLLRTYVRQKDQDLKKNQRTKTSMRYTKKLKIMQQFANKLSLKDKTEVKVQTNEQEKPPYRQKIERSNSFRNVNIQDPLHLFWGSPFTPIEEKAILDCQNNFFKDFQNLMQQPNDPFIPFTNFKRTKSIFGDQNSSSNISF